MPKKNRNQRNWYNEGSGSGGRKFYYEHDDRDDRNDRNDYMRRVSFNSNSKVIKYSRNRDWDAPKNDDDIDIPHPRSSRGRYTPYKPGPSNKKNNKNHNNTNRPLPMFGPSNWYKITIVRGAKYPKSHVLSNLHNYINNTPFTPFTYGVSELDSFFFVDDYVIANKLIKADKKISFSDGFKMIIRVNPGFPKTQITDELKEKIKLTMSRRYNAEFQALNLSNFHHDPDLSQEFVVGLFKTEMILLVLDIISENIPQLKALDLSDNKIYGLQHLSGVLLEKIPNLTILHLSKNRIREMSTLDCLQGVPLVELALDENPLCNRFKDQNAYIRYLSSLHLAFELPRTVDKSINSEVRKRFPKVVKLDSLELPPPITFDVSEDFDIPSSKQTFLCNPEARTIIMQFLEQYYQFYDSDRQQLLAAYQDDSIFSLSAAYPPSQSSYNGPKLNDYLTKSRNLHKVKESQRRSRLLKCGKLAIVSHLLELPKTQHDPNSFTVDLLVSSAHLMHLSVTGIFKEIDNEDKETPMRSFNRVFIIVPSGSGFCIANEQLFITNCTQSQIKTAFKTPSLEPTTTINSIQGTSTAINNNSNVPLQAQNLEETRNQMLHALALQTGMNPSWTKKCLEEQGWDFQKASFVFSELQKQGLIPQEAFQM